MAENDWDLTPKKIPVSQVIGGVINSSLNESEQVKKLLDQIELLKGNTDNSSLITELEDTKNN
ncbi:MAG: hypothetical protein RCO49_00045 [Rickettsia endosymbiont of Argas persicus]